MRVTSDDGTRRLFVALADIEEDGLALNTCMVMLFKIYQDNRGVQGCMVTSSLIEFLRHLPNDVQDNESYWRSNQNIRRSRRYSASVLLYIFMILG